MVKSDDLSLFRHALLELVLQFFYLIHDVEEAGLDLVRLDYGCFQACKTWRYCLNQELFTIQWRLINLNGDIDLLIGIFWEVKAWSRSQTFVLFVNQIVFNFQIWIRYSYLLFGFSSFARILKRHIIAIIIKIGQSASVPYQLLWVNLWNLSKKDFISFFIGIVIFITTTTTNKISFFMIINMSCTIGYTSIQFF